MLHRAWFRETHLAQCSKGHAAWLQLIGAHPGLGDADIRVLPSHLALHHQSLTVVCRRCMDDN